MNVEDIVKKWLEENGYEGLYSPDVCGCELSDLFPCGAEFINECKPGYKKINTIQLKPEEGVIYDDTPDFWIVGKKPADDTLDKVVELNGG